MEIIIAHPQNTEKLKAVKAVLKALDISFETKADSTYDPAFVSKILQGQQDIKNGKGTKIKVQNLWK